MGAHIKHIYQCPRCSTELVAATVGTRCPECDYTLGERKGARAYAPPLTLYEQHLKYQNKQQHINALQGLHHNKAVAMLQDALNIIEILPGKNCPVSGIREIVELARSIGTIADAYDKYLHSGGQHVPGVLIELEEPPSSPTTTNTQQESNHEQSALATTGGPA